MTLLLIAHFIADFILQSREMGKNKSKNYIYLTSHIWIIFCVVSFFAYFVFGSLEKAILFSFWNALFHMLIDSLTWNIYGCSVLLRIYGYDQVFDKDFNFKDKSKTTLETFKWWEDHWFMVTIGADQIAHMIVLFELFKYFS